MASKAGADEIRRLERIASAAWPPAHVEEFDGWLLYESGGGPRRTQSVQPLRFLGDDVESAIERCERFYQDRDQDQGHDTPCVFKVTAASEPAQLDTALERRGYARSDETIVRIATPLPDADSTRVRIRPTPSTSWLECCAALSGGEGRDARAHAATLQRVVARRASSAFASIDVDGGIAAIGLGAIEDEVCFIGEVATDPGHRRAGHGRAIVEALMAWAAEAGAREALLQVVAANTRARALYDELGFRERYRYWYRSRPSHDARSQ